MEKLKNKIDFKKMAEFQKTNWTKKEEKIIIEAMKYGVYAMTLYKSGILPGRTYNSIMNKMRGYR